MRSLLLGTALALAACASGSGQRPTANNATASDPNLICREEAPTGTTITHQVCRTPERMQEEKKSADDFLRLPPSRTQNTD
jgi:hypothetical protein